MCRCLETPFLRLNLLVVSTAILVTAAATLAGNFLVGLAISWVVIAVTLVWEAYQLWTRGRLERRGRRP